jgi:serine/threonine protein kinase
LGPGHYRLWKLGIHHRDISTGNLMYRRDKNGHAYGTLSDFDLASISGEQSNNKQRTGTLPFMAIELLSAHHPIVHKYEHDVESFYWVLLCAVLCAEDGRTECPMIGWGNLGMEALRKNKNDYINTSHRFPDFQPEETRRNDFNRFGRVRSAIRALIRNALEDEPHQQPETIPVNVDKVYKMLEEEHEQGVKDFSLDSVRPEFSERSLLSHNSSMV